MRPLSLTSLYKRKLKKYASLKLLFAMSPSDPRQLPRAESRVAGFSEAMRMGVRTTTTPGPIPDK